MFKKLLTNLPFNPGLLSQLSSYRLRLRHETRLRALGLMLLVLTLLVQLIAANYAPQRLAKEVPADCIYSVSAKCVSVESNNGQLVTIVISGAVVVSGYLFLRSRLMGRELEGIRNQYTSSGGL